MTKVNSRNCCLWSLAIHVMILNALNDRIPCTLYKYPWKSLQIRTNEYLSKQHVFRWCRFESFVLWKFVWNRVVFENLFLASLKRILKWSCCVRILVEMWKSRALVVQWTTDDICTHKAYFITIKSNQHDRAREAYSSVEKSWSRYSQNKKIYCW